jgi:hypothetical protein
MKVYGIGAGLALAGLLGCANTTAGAPAARPSETDATYYGMRAAALEKAGTNEVGRIDFVRFRRGRLYAGGGNAALDRALNEELTTAFEAGNFAAVVATTGRMLAIDQADIRGHMLRAIALRKLRRPLEADFHHTVAMGLIRSIEDSGDGRGFKTAWTIFQVKEEYELIKVLGGIVESQSLESKGGRMYDVLEARKAQGGDTFRVYFDITELFEEQTRRMGGRSAAAAD